MKNFLEVKIGTVPKQYRVSAKLLKLGEIGVPKGIAAQNVFLEGKRIRSKNQIRSKLIKLDQPSVPTRYYFAPKLAGVFRL